MEGLIGFVIIAVIAYILIQRGGGKPSLGDSFACSACGTQVKHNKRTVAAWERGSRSFFCRACHGKWRDEQAAKRSGCLGTVALLVVIPVAIISSIFTL